MGATRIIAALARRTDFEWRFVIERKILGRVQNGDLLTGLLVDNTACKNTVRVWDFALPWFHPTGSLALNFCRMIGSGSYVQGDTSTIVARISDLITMEKSTLNFMSPTFTHDDFLAQNQDLMIFHVQYPVSIVFDVAAVNSLSGKDGIAFQMFSSLTDRLHEYPESNRVRAMSIACLDQLRAGQSIRPVLDPVAAENKASWRITPVKHLAEKSLRRTLPESSRRIATIGSSRR